MVALLVQVLYKVMLQMYCKPCEAGRGLRRASALETHLRQSAVESLRS